MRATQLYGIVAAAFMAGAFIASPELRAYAANTVFSSDIVDGEVKSADIATNAVKSAEIATDAVGASELQGVTKLIFRDCSVTNNDVISPGSSTVVECSASGADNDDSAIASVNASPCFAPTKVDSLTNDVAVSLRNVCSVSTALGAAQFSIIVYDS